MIVIVALVVLIALGWLYVKAVKTSARGYKRMGRAARKIKSRK